MKVYNSQQKKTVKADGLKDVQTVVLFMKDGKILSTSEFVNLLKSNGNIPGGERIRHLTIHDPATSKQEINIGF